MTRIVVQDNDSYIYGQFPSGEVDRALSYFVPGFFFAQSYKDGFWDGRFRFLRSQTARGRWRFPTGLLHLVTRTLAQYGWEYDLDDQRNILHAEPDYNVGDFDIRSEKYDYQADALDAMLLHGRGVVCVPTGGGKTVIGGAAIKSYNLQSAWLTHSVVLGRQSQESLQKILGEPVGFIGDGAVDVQKVSVVMVQTATSAIKREKQEILEFLRGCEVAIGDEIHHLEADTWYRLLEEMPASARFGLSATVSEDGKGMRIAAQTGPIIYKISMEELIDRGVVVQPRLWFASPECPKLEAKLPYASVYSQGVVHNSTRNALICRIAGVMKLEKKPTLILVNRLNHGKMLCDLLASRGLEYGWIHGKVLQEDREQTIKDMCQGRIAGIVAVAATMGEGVDMPDLRAVINATGTKGGRTKDDETGRMSVQILGRGLRSTKASKLFGEKKHFDYFDFVDDSHRHLMKAAEARLETFENEGYAKCIKYWDQYELQE